MSYRSFITIVITAAALTSCTLTRSYHCDSYVQQYYNMEGLSLSLDHEQDSVWVNLNGAEVSFAGSFISKGEEKQVYDRLWMHEPGLPGQHHEDFHGWIADRTSGLQAGSSR